MAESAYQRFKEKYELERIEAQESAKQLAWVHRPILVHGRRKEPSSEPCCEFCNSPYTVIEEEIRHLDVMFDIDTGERVARHELTDEGKAEFDALCADSELVERYDLPWLCHRGQLEAVLDFDSKVIFAFGGQRAGKTEIGKGKMIDYWLLHGGPDRIFYWVANELQICMTGVEKLCRGPGSIPDVLITYYPKAHTAQDKFISLIDGSVIQLHHTRGKSGGSLKSRKIYGGVMDEGCEVQNEETWHAFVGRTQETGAQIVVPTTPLAGHWLETYDKQAVTYEEAKTMDEWPLMVKVHITAYSNPWIQQRHIDEVIAVTGGKDSAGMKRNVLGLWVADGDRLWPHFENDERFVTAHDPLDSQAWVDITAQLALPIFRKSSKGPFPWVLGCDFNFGWMASAVCHVLAKRNSDTRNPDNWCLYVSDELCYNARDENDYIHWLCNVAGQLSGRGGQANAHMFAGSHCIVDGTGFYRKNHSRANAKPWATIMRDAGFIVRPPERHRSGAEANPPRDVRIGYMNRLMFEGRFMVNAKCSNLIHSLEIEIRTASGDTAKRSSTKADKDSGITDGTGYLAYALMYKPEKRARKNHAIPTATVQSARD